MAVIRFFYEKDLEKCVDIVNRNYNKKEGFYARKEMDRIYYKDKPREDYSVICVAIEDDKVVGFLCCAWSWFSDNVAEIYWFNILQEYRFRGIADKLLEFLFRYLKGIDESNEFKPDSIILESDKCRAKYYELKGFKEIAKLKRNSVIMLKQLN